MKLTNENAKCLLCADAPCNKACRHKQTPSGMLQSIRFSNEKGAGRYISTDLCKDCDAPCESVCINTVPIKSIALNLPPQHTAHADLSIEFCGIKCENPFFLSSSVVASNYEMCARALSMGWAGIVYKTICMFNLKEASPRFSVLGKKGSPFAGFRNIEQLSEHTLEEDLAILKRLKEDFPNKVIVASIMGSTDEEWTHIAKRCTEVGCDIIECNFSCPNMTEDGLGVDIGTDPQLVAHYIACTRKGTHLPILAKMTPNLTSIEPPAIAAIENGADGIAAINTIKSITGFELPEIEPGPSVNGKSIISGYSGRAVKPIALRFIHDLAVCGRLNNAPISGMGGIYSWHDAAEFIALGCTNVQITTAVMEYGYRIIYDLIDGLSAFLAENNYNSLDELVGKGIPHIVEAAELDRDTVSYPKFIRNNCIGCGRCYISCMDGGHQAIDFGEERRPVLKPDKCVGCHLCVLVCPNEAIEAGARVAKRR